jgi:hypothetical protein
MTEEEKREYRAAVSYVLLVIRQPLMLMSPDRLKALALVEQHNITVADLIAHGRNRAEHT